MPLERWRGTRNSAAVGGEALGGAERRWSARREGEAHGEYVAEVGEQAPDFTLSSPTGETVTLHQYREKQWVLLEFYIGGGIPAEHPT